MVARWDASMLVDHPERFVDHLQKIAGVTFDKLGQLPVCAYLYARQMPRPGEPPVVADRVFLTGLERVDEATKDQLAAFVKSLVEPMQLAAIGWASEVWHVKATVGDGVEEQLRAWQRAHNGAYEGFPHAEERAMLLFDTTHGISQHWAPIERPARGRPKLGAWQRMPTPTVVSGRLVSMFHQDAKTTA